jgi:hypothetical protein
VPALDPDNMKLHSNYGVVLDQSERTTVKKHSFSGRSTSIRN